MTIRVQDGNGRFHNKVGPEELRALLGVCEEFLIVEDSAREAECYAQAMVMSAERDWRVEVRDGGPDRHVATVVADDESALELLNMWAGGGMAWQQAADWFTVQT